MNIQMVLILAAVGVGLYFLSKLLFRADTNVEERRRRAITLSAWCHTNGLPGLAQLLNSYAVGDYSGTLFHVRNLSDILADPVQSQSAVDAFLRNQLDKQVSTPEGREKLVQYVEEKLRVKIPRELLQLQPAALTVKPEAKEAPLTVGPAAVKVTQTREKEVNVADA